MSALFDSDNCTTAAHLQLQVLAVNNIASNKFNAVEKYPQFPWQRGATGSNVGGPTLNRRLPTKRSTSGENDSGPV